MAFLCIITLDVKAETLTYEVCDTCEYTNLSDVSRAISNIDNLSDKDIIVNIESNISNGIFQIGSKGKLIKTITINGNIYSQFYRISIYNCQKININNLDVREVEYISMDQNDQIISKEVNPVFNFDNITLNKLKTLRLTGNIKLENTNLSNQVILIEGGKINIYNSMINKILNISIYGDINIKIYNSKFNLLKYKNIISSSDEAINEIDNYDTDESDISCLHHDIYDINVEEFNMHSTTTVYFDKETKLKPNDKLNLVNYLDYYTEDKEIDYIIEDESIAKIESKKLIALKEGSTKVTVTTDEGHVVYNINLVVEKETLPEKIDKMTIKVPITGSRVKAWVAVVSVIFLVVIGICLYMLIRRKK